MPSTREVTISIYDYAHVLPEALTASENDAVRIFRQAGIETVWVNCLPKAGSVDLKLCDQVDALHLVLKVLPRAIIVEVRDRTDVLGTALLDEKGAGFYAYAFYDRVQRVAEEHRLGHSRLGNVLAHEIGHLLLKSKSHAVSGIMSARWNVDELRKLSEGTMFFTPGQCRALRDHVGARQIDVRFLTHASASKQFSPPL
jgi:hypothetical protein